MVHKQYKKKNGKLIGPYYYESYRDGDKVKKRYIGRNLPIGLKLNVLKSMFFVLIFGFVFFSLIVLVGGDGSDSSSAGEWLMFGRYFNHTGYYAESLTVNVSQGLGNSFNVDSALGSAPVGNSNYIYVVSNTNGVVFQLNTTNISQQIANFSMGVASTSTPAIAGDYLYVGNDDNRTFQLNATNVSQQIANFTTVGRIRSSPVVSGGYVYVITEGGYIYQLNATNVSIMFANRSLGNSWKHSAYSPAIFGNSIYFAMKIGIHPVVDYTILSEHNISNISQMNQNRTFSSGPNVGDFSVTNNSLYIYLSEGGARLAQFNRSNLSQELFNYSVASGGIPAEPPIPTVANGYVYFPGGNSDFLQLNASNVSQHIANRSSLLANIESKAFPVGGDSTFLVDTGNLFYQLNATNVSQLIGISGAGGGDGTPSIIGGAVFVGRAGVTPALLQYGNVSFADTISPRVTINFPGNRSYKASDLPLNFNVSLHENGSVRYSLDGGTTNITMFKSTNGDVYGTEFNATNNSMVDGGYTFRAYANDTSGNTNYTEKVNFVYDSIGPVVTINLPTSTTYATSSYAVNITLNEPGYCEYSLDSGMTNSTLTAGANNKDFTGTVSGSSNGGKVLRAYCNDTAGNTNYTINVSYTVSVPSGDTGGGGGGGGGGGSGGSIPPVVQQPEPTIGEGCSLANCGAWSVCDSVTKRKTRTCGLIGNSCTESSVVREARCDLEVCISEWECGAWSSPFNGKIYRKCLDVNQCAMKRRLGIVL